ncbi:MAG TPA: hypothetical protein PKC76_01515 [Saprospiraceae bacterium]|nr:hypothetical protein [Saprospiraceae bacterium]HMP22773.1 hypothetical protein [Saprospiraceae bacterium]
MLQKKRFIAGAVLLLALLWSWHYFFRLPLLPVSPAAALPSTTAVALSLPDGRAFLQNTSPLSIDSLLQQWLHPAQGRPEISSLQHYIRQMPELQSAPFPLWLSLQNAGTGRLTPLLIIDARKASLSMDTLIARWSPDRLQTFHYRGRTLYQLVFADGKALALAKYRNLLLLSRYPLLVEDALKTLEKPYKSLPQTTAFAPLRYRQPAQHMGSLWINPANLRLLLEDWWLPAGLEAVQRAGTAVQWIRLDPEPAIGNMVRLSGQWTPGRPEKTLTAQTPRVLQANMLEVIPDNAALVRWYSLSHPSKLSGGESFRRYVQPWMHGAAALVQTSTDQALVLGFREADAVQTALNALAESVEVLQLYDYQTFTIMQIAEDDLLPTWMTGGDKLRNPYFVTLGNYVVFTDSRAALEIWIDEYIVGKTLAKSPEFLRVYQKLHGTPMQQLLYANLVNLAPQIRESLQTQGLIAAGQPERTGQIAVASTLRGATAQLNGYWMPARTAKAAPPTAIAWKTVLDFPAITAPMPIGLDAQGPIAIAVQDSAFNLYLLRPNGRELWRKKLDGPLLSPVHSITYYDANTVSLFFNTAHNIYLLGMDGAAQGAFPIRLQTPATNGVTVVDFNQNRDYSFFVACANGAIYGFDKLGRPLPGWNPLRGVGKLKHPILHWQYKARDYLVAWNEDGRLMTFQRDGSPRLAARNLAPGLSPPDFDLAARHNRIVATDQNGLAHIMPLEGNAFQLRLLPRAGGPVHFTLADVTGDERKDYIALNGETLAVHFYDENQFKLLYTWQNGATWDALCVVAVPGQEKALPGLISHSRKQIQVLNAAGKAHPDFPLGGDSAFFIADLYSNGQTILVVANRESIYAYRVNLTI